MKRILSVSLLFLLFAGICSAQYTYRRKNMPLVDLNGAYKLSGWHFAPGISYTFTRFKNSEEVLYDANDTVYKATIDPGGRIGLYLEAGRFNIFKYGYLINYMDYSLAFKQIRGKESYTGSLLQESSSTVLMNTEGNGTYSHSFITGNFNLSNVYQLNDLEFLQNSIGFNVDYRLFGNTAQSGQSQYQDPQNPARFMAQLHYKLGYGFKWTDRLFVIPTLETPILSVITWANGRSTYDVFSSRYRPVYLTIRFAFLKKKTNDCPTVDGHPDDKRKQQQYQQER